MTSSHSSLCANFFIINWRDKYFLQNGMPSSTPFVISSSSMMTSILEWAVDKNGQSMIKGTSSSSEARISFIMFEFSCLLANSAINLDNDSYMLGFQSGYKEFPLFRWWNPGLATLYCPPGHYAVLSLQNTPYCLEEQIHRLDCRIQYAVLGRKFDTSYLAGGYGVSGDQSE
nr:hypothetical protein [Tanacetum cinerariifolium]